MVYLPLFTYIWLIFRVNVGKYTSPMDPMGYTPLRRPMGIPVGRQYSLASQETSLDPTLEDFKRSRRNMMPTTCLEDNEYSLFPYDRGWSSTQ